jgi:hypothetical protein
VECNLAVGAFAHEIVTAVSFSLISLPPTLLAAAALPLVTLTTGLLATFTAAPTATANPAVRVPLAHHSSAYSFSATALTEIGVAAAASTTALFVTTFITGNREGSDRDHQQRQSRRDSSHRFVGIT